MHCFTRFVVALFALLWANSASAEWREATTPHFIIVSDGPESQLIQMAQLLEGAHWLMQQVTRADTSRNGARVRIYLVDDQRDVHRAMGISPGSNVAGFYRASELGAHAVVPRTMGSFSSTILLHEYAHHFMLQYLRQTYPSWLVEGFAEVFSTARINRDGEISYGYPAEHRVGELVNEPWIPVARVFAPPPGETRQRDEPSYGQYWLMAHYLMRGEGRRGQIDAFIAALNRGQPLEEAYSAFPGGLEALDRDMRRYLQSNRFLTSRLVLPPDVARRLVIRVMRPGEAAIIPDELQALRPLSAEAHVPIAMRVQALSARYPDDPAVSFLEAQLWRWAERLDLAEAAVDRTLALAPNHVRALTLKGQVMLERRRADNGTMDAAFIRSARSYIVRANRADTEDQIPLLTYYWSFGFVDQEPPPAAVDGLLKAMELVPQDRNVRAMAVMALIQRRELPLARLLLQPLAVDGHNPQGRARALQLIGWIDAGANGDPPDPDSADATPAPAAPAGR